MGYGMKYTKGGFPFKEIETGTDRVSAVSPSPALNGEKDASVKVSELGTKGKTIYNKNNPKPNNEYNRVNAMTDDGSGPVKPVNQTVASNTRKLEQSGLVDELDNKTEYVDADIENEKVSLKEGNVIKKELQSKADKLRSQEYKDYNAKSKKNEYSR